MALSRIDTDPRMSDVVIHNDTIYLAGQVGTPGQPVEVQTKEVLDTIERLLEQAGSDKSHILRAMIWLADIADFEKMNAVWDGWIAGFPAPARATAGVKLASPEYLVEIIVVAAKANS